MRSDGGEETVQCHDCKPCKDCTDFQKVLDLKNAGLIIYRHKTRTEDINKNTELLESNTNTTEDVFILHKTKKYQITSADFLSELEQSKISCPRCINIIKHAQKLLQNVPSIDKKDIMGVCDHCRMKDRPRNSCYECEEIVKKFVASRDIRKEETEERIKIWLSKIKHFLTNVAVDGEEPRKENLRARSDLYIDKLCQEMSPRSVREPEVQQMFQPDKHRSDATETQNTLQTIKKIFDTKLYHPHLKKIERSVIFIDSMKPQLNTLRQTKKKDIFQSEQDYKNISNVDREIFDSKYYESRQQNTEDKKALHTLPSRDAENNYVRQQRLKSMKEYRISGYEKPQKGTIRTLYNSNLESGAYFQKGRKNEGRYEETALQIDGHYTKTFHKYAEESSQQTTDTKQKSKPHLQSHTDEQDYLHYPSKFERKRTAKKDSWKVFEPSSRITKSHSEEALITSISGITEDFPKKDFSYFFPKDVKYTLETERRVSSSELIKNTQEMLLTRAEKEKVKLEEERIKKLEEKEKQRITREEKKRLVKEKRKCEQERKRLEVKKKKEDKESIDESKQIKPENKESEENEKSIKEKVTPISSKTETKDILTTSEKSKETKSKFEPNESKLHKEALKAEKEAEKSGKEQERKEKEVILRREKDEKQKQKEEKLRREMEEKQRQKEEKLKREKEEKQRQKEEKEEKLRREKDAKQSQKEDKEEKLKREKEEKQRQKEEKEEKLRREKDAKQSQKEDKLSRETEEKQRQTERYKREKEEQLQKEREGKGGSLKKPDLTGNNKEENFNLKKREDEFERLAKEARNKKNIYESEVQTKSIPEKPQPDKRGEEPTTKELNINQIKLRKPSLYQDDLILQLVKLRQSNPIHERVKAERLSQINISPIAVNIHKTEHKHKKAHSCVMCVDSNLELDVNSIELKNDKAVEITDIIIGHKILKYKPPHVEKNEIQGVVPILFQSTYKDEPVPVKSKKIVEVIPEEIDHKSVPPILSSKATKVTDQEVPKGIIRYTLSDRTFIDKGWTMLPTEKVVRKMNVYRMRPAHPEFDWFEHNKNKRLMHYDTGEKLAEFEDNGRGRWYYRNGHLALDYYDAEETNAHQRFVVYSSGEPDERGRSHPITILATFDYLGNGIVFDHAGKIRLKYNQTEGVVLDRGIGPVSHWKWHTLNDPPVLQQVMIDTQMSHKDPEILKLGGPSDNKSRPDNEEMLAIEFDNFIKEKSKKLTQSFKPFQIKMKALKINEHFSLKVLDQATVYLIYRDGSTNLKLNIGMILDHKEIVDTDTAEVGEVSNNLERFPARTDSLAGLQRSVAYAQRFERSRTERERRLRPPEPCGSADKLTAAVSNPLRPPLQTVTSGSTKASGDYCKCNRKPSSSNMYYDTRLF